MFLHQVEDGPANRSYGLQVARLAGVPADTVKQAQRYFARLDKFNRRDDAQHDLFATAAIVGSDSSPASSSGSASTTAQLDSHLASGDAIRARLRELDPDALSPRDALAALYALKKLAE